MSDRVGEDCGVARRKILVTISHYLPAYRAGGPIRSTENTVVLLGGEFDFKILTSDRDLGDTRGFDSVEVGGWVSVGMASVRYVKRGILFAWRMLQALSRSDCDLIYLNGYFDWRFSLLPAIFYRIWRRNVPVIIAPRGEFSSGAIALKSWKKQPYHFLVQWLGIHRNAWWHASTTAEANDIERVAGVPRDRILMAPDPAVLQRFVNGDAWGGGARQALRIVFLSRISEKKNLDFALNVLRQVRRPVVFSVWGPTEDEGYWNYCLSLVDKLGSNVKFEYCGIALPEQVGNIFGGSDLFFLPTRGENFGHVIAESLSSGTPVLISDQTPWRGLAESGAGWDLPLEQEAEFVYAIESLEMQENVLRVRRLAARAFAEEILCQRASFEANRDLFLKPILSAQVLHEH